MLTRDLFRLFVVANLLVAFLNSTKIPELPHTTSGQSTVCLWSRSSAACTVKSSII